MQIDLYKRRSRKERSIMANTSNVGQEIYDFAASIFPYCRSITGAGVRKTLATISDAISSNAVISTPMGGGK